VGIGSTSKITQGQAVAVAGDAAEPNRRKSMAKKAKKPAGFRAFDALARKLVGIAGLMSQVNQCPWKTPANDL
jgi:hypothetical protein